MNKDFTIALGVAAVAIVVLLLARNQGGGQTIAVTGPSEGVSKALIAAGTETTKTAAALQRDIANIFTSGTVNLASIDSRERTALATVASQERVRTAELTTQERIASTLAETERFRVQSQTDVQRQAVNNQQQRGIFDFILQTIPFFFAEGGDTVVKTPTVMVVGERGPERVTVRPATPVATPARGQRAWSRLVA